MGSVDGILNCVGSVLLKPAHLTSPEEWQETLAINLTSAFSTVRAGYKVMQKSGGAIVLMTTAAARIGLPNHVHTLHAWLQRKTRRLNTRLRVRRPVRWLRRSRFLYQSDRQ